LHPQDSARTPFLRVADAKPTMIERVAASISVHEGWKNLKSLVRRQHNPGALIYVGQPGARMGKNGYAWFKTDEDGKAALLADLRAKSGRGWTLRQIMERWIVRSYGKEVSRETGIRLGGVLLPASATVLFCPLIKSSHRRLTPSSIHNAPGFSLMFLRTRAITVTTANDKRAKEMR
jgi:hypothetical protein